ncbi:sensor histidine kinase [Clostridium sp.]|uniref:sensor histidine kinase n=1 Tax=Clostridium sp. TaxID=1506 RepID=UPI002634CFFC|nr:ATP-binding protein [uncultured Clostridium sp.]
MNKKYEFKIEKILNLKTFLEHSKSVICFSLDYEGNVLFCNEGYKRILGYNEKNIKDKLINPLIESLIDENLTNNSTDNLVFNGIITLKKLHLNSSFISQIYKISNELFFLCEYDGLEIETLFKEMSYNTLSINNMNRELVKKEIMLKNAICKQKETQTMLVQFEKMNALGQLAAGIVHEINNPLTYVMGNIEVIGQYFQSIKSFFEDYEIKKIDNISIIKEKYDMNYILNDFSVLQKATLEGTEKIKKIVSDLRDYSRVDDSEKILCNIEECIKNSLNLVKSEIKRKSTKLNLNFSKTTDIECYPSQLNQVFLNIIINAVQAAGENGEITINLYEKEKYIIVEIEDNGDGILAENKSKIFEPFFTTKPRGVGVGLGLYLSYRIIKDIHKGEICFDSISGKGTIFTIFIPKGVI